MFDLILYLYLSNVDPQDQTVGSALLITEPFFSNISIFSCMCFPKTPSIAWTTTMLLRIVFADTYENHLDSFGWSG